MKTVATHPAGSVPKTFAELNDLLPLRPIHDEKELTDAEELRLHSDLVEARAIGVGENGHR